MVDFALHSKVTLVFLIYTIDSQRSRMPGAVRHRAGEAGRERERKWKRGIESPWGPIRRCSEGL